MGAASAKKPIAGLGVAHSLNCHSGRRHEPMTTRTSATCVLKTRMAIFFENATDLGLMGR